MPILRLVFDFALFATGRLEEGTALERFISFGIHERGLFRTFGISNIAGGRLAAGILYWLGRQPCHFDKRRNEHRQYADHGQ